MVVRYPKRGGYSRFGIRREIGGRSGIFNEKSLVSLRKSDLSGALIRHRIGEFPKNNSKGCFRAGLPRFKRGEGDKEILIPDLVRLDRERHSLPE